MAVEIIQETSSIVGYFRYVHEGLYAGHDADVLLTLLILYIMMDLVIGAMFHCYCIKYNLSFVVIQILIH